MIAHKSFLSLAKKSFVFAVGLFGVFIVVGSGGIKLLCAGTIMYAVVRTIVAFAHA